MQELSRIQKFQAYETTGYKKGERLPCRSPFLLLSDKKLENHLVRVVNTIVDTLVLIYSS